MADLFPEEPSGESTFQDAVEALRRGDKPRAKELLTSLLKTDQNNATYWVWLSAAVDNSKERIYCLQTAIKLDPQNSTAKRGLILLGAMEPDETVQPFPMNRPRAWEEKLLLAHERPKERGLKINTRSPVVRLMGLTILSVALCAVVVFGFILPNRVTIQPTNTNTPGPSPTFTSTPTIFGAAPAATSTYIGPTPLWMLLPATYTPTPFYVNTPRDPLNYDQYRTAKVAYERGDWDTFIQNMRLIARSEPKSADVQYFIGEAYRFKRQASDALKAYNNALEIDPKFGAAYLGLARARLIQDPDVNVEYLFNEALARDPKFGEIYLERARYFLFHNNPQAAIEDLDQAVKLMPNSADVQLAYAQAYLALDDNENALKYAEKAYSLDITNLTIYPILGELYIDIGQYQRSVEALDLYVIYRDEDSRAFAMLGQSYYRLENYEAAIENLSKAFSLNPNGSRRYRVYRGLAYLELNEVDKAVSDLEQTAETEETAFEMNLGLVRGYYLQGKFGTAFLRVETLGALAKTDQEVATALYWRALIQEKRGEQKDAVKSWLALLDMDPDAMTSAMRTEADQHLRKIATPTNTRKAGTGTPTPRVTTTSTKKP